MNTWYSFGTGRLLRKRALRKTGGYLMGNEKFESRCTEVSIERTLPFPRIKFSLFLGHGSVLCCCWMIKVSAS